MEKENHFKFGTSSSSNNFMIGTSVNRNIEGVWFHAIVQSSCCRRRRCTIKYTDDDNLEDVSFDDLRCSEHMVSKDSLPKEPDSSNNNSPHRGPRSIKDSLPKPLAGMLVDDSKDRINHLPTITVHTDDTEENAIIINGGRLGVGGGLRALRYLKK